MKNYRSMKDSDRAVTHENDPTIALTSAQQSAGISMPNETVCDSARNLLVSQ